MKKALWWILGVLLSPVLLFVVLTVLLYLPPVQNWAVDKVAEIASEKTGMQITVGEVRLAFPLDLSIDRFQMRQQGDTIADVERMVVDVQLLPLFSKTVVINQLEVTNTSLNTASLVEAARVKGRFGRLFVSSKGIDLDQQTVEANGTRLENAFLDVQLNDSVPEDTTTSENLWKIHVDEAAILASDVVLHMPGDTMSVSTHFGALKATEALIDLGTQTYTVGSVEWGNGRLQYDQNYEPRIEGLDFNHIDLDNIHIAIDSIYFHDPTLRLQLRQVALKEKSGLQVTNLTGPVVMEDGNLRLPKFRLTTPESDIDVELDMPLALMDKANVSNMRLRLNAQLGRNDVLRFLNTMPAAFRDQWPQYPLTVRGLLNGNMQQMDFQDVEIALPTAFQATASGYAANIDDLQHLRADVQFKAATQNLTMVTAMLPRDMQRNYRLPPMSAEGRVKAADELYAADVTLREGKGSVKAKGSYHARTLRYDANVSVRDLNVHHFMPRDSIYTVSADVTAKGQGTDFLSPRTTLQADARVHHLRYGSWALDNINATARMGNGHALIDVLSDNPLVKGHINMDALMNPKKLVANLSADIKHVDLYRMQLTEDPLKVGLCGSFDVNSDLKLTHYLSGLISDITISDSANAQRTEFIGIHARSDCDTTLLRAQSGDFIVKLDASGDYERVLRQLTVFTDSVMAQYHRKTINQPALRSVLPDVKLHVEGKQDNPIAAMLKTAVKTEFKDLLFDMHLSPVSGVNGHGHIHSLVASDIRLDTINFRLTQREQNLSFGGQIRNNKRNPQFVFNALFDGIVQERGATIGVRYYDAANKMGARIGAKAEVVDSGLSLHLVPERPTIGYKVFALNKDNYIFLGSDKKVRANVSLRADDGQGLRVYSEETDPTALQDLTVTLHQINLDELTSVIPYAPRMSGTLNGDIHVIQNAEGQLSAVNDMNVRNLFYERCPIGNVSTEMVYLQKEDDTHAVEARLLKDDVEVGLLTGTYYNTGDGALDAKLTLQRLPLSIVNGFVPDQLCGLYGYGDGEFTVHGPVSAPIVNGELLLDSSYVESVPYGVTLRFDNDPVRIENSNLMFDNFTVYSLNENPLNISGYVNFRNMDRIMTDLRIRARNFQLIGTKERNNSVAFGKAFVDVYSRVQGPLDNLYMRGRLNVLPSTDVSYILRDSPLTTDNQMESLVKFTDFSDTTQVVVERPALTGFRMDMTVDVSKGTHVKAYLNSDHSNYIDLMGGGTLRMSYSPADNMHLTGRYTLSNGEMKYALPIIPLKTFTIQDGSYVEFTGEMMNPTLNITATERTKANVTNASGVGRSVDFDCGVIITKTLNDMGLQFILDAPEDMQLHSELLAMGAEQRGKLAVTMLTTGMYLADGNTGSFSMNSALSSFLNSQISSISGNALRTLDLSFGMDNTTDASGMSHTDYSFKFAKRFLNNRLKVAVGGKVTTGQEMPGGRNNSFFDNVSMEYRLDQSASRYLNVYFQNNSYDWLDGYTQKYGAGFIWRRSLQKFTDIFRLKAPRIAMPAMRRDTLKTTPAHETK